MGLPLELTEPPHAGCTGEEAGYPGSRKNQGGGWLEDVQALAARPPPLPCWRLLCLQKVRPEVPGGPCWKLRCWLRRGALDLLELPEHLDTLENLLQSGGHLCNVVEEPNCRLIRSLKSGSSNTCIWEGSGYPTSWKWDAGTTGFSGRAISRAPDALPITSKKWLWPSSVPGELSDYCPQDKS